MDERPEHENDQALPIPSRPTFPGYEFLTPREREILEAVCAGSASKEIGRALKISPRTVEVHRARIMHKVGARNAADLVRIYFTGSSS
jgi:DNA-binding NarL/FixJ family response regulator